MKDQPLDEDKSKKGNDIKIREMNFNLEEKNYFNNAYINSKLKIDLDAVRSSMMRLCIAQSQYTKEEAEILRRYFDLKGRYILKERQRCVNDTGLPEVHNMSSSNPYNYGNPIVFMDKFKIEALDEMDDDFYYKNENHDRSNEVENDNESENTFGKKYKHQSRFKSVKEIEKSDFT